MRLLALVLTLLVGSMVVFGSLAISAGDDVTALTGGRAVSPEVREGLERKLGLDQALPERYVNWLAHAVQGDFGYSVKSQASVGSILAPRIWLTLELLVLSLLITVVVGIGFGMLAGLRKGKVDGAVLLLSSIGLAIPSFLLALLLVGVFAVNLKLLPAVGGGSGGLDRLEHLILPAIALSGLAAAYLTRITRTAIREELQAEHVETAFARGLPRRAVWRRHVLRNAAIPIATSGAILVAGLLAGTVIVEQAFSIDGLGSYLVSSVENGDIPVVQAITLILMLVFVLLSFVLDVVYVRMDPRIAVGRVRS